MNENQSNEKSISVVKSNEASKGFLGFLNFFFKQKIFVTFIFTIIVLLVFLSFQDLLFENISKTFTVNLFIMITILMFTGIVYRGILIYLNEDHLKIKAGLTETGIPTAELNGDMENRDIRIHQETNLLLSDDEKRTLFNEIVSELSNKLSFDFENKFNQNSGSFRYKEIKQNFEKIQNRINTEIYSLNKRSNVNLGIGVATTVGAILILFYANYIIGDKTFENWQSFMFFFIPKFSIAVFLEIFSFYFLAIYKANLNEIKYYQNELSDIDFKNMVLQTSLLTEGYNIEELGNKLITSNRNSVLKGDELTVDLKRTEVENQLLRDFLNKIPNVNEFFSSEKKKNSD